MKYLPLYVVDAFADRPFTGNPAAVVPLEEWCDNATLQAMAAEHNLSETAFLVREGQGWRLRWFTPVTEVALCGHATLAAAFVLATELGEAAPFAFATKSGTLTVTREGELFVLDFPADPPEPVTHPPSGLAAALGAEPRAVWKARDWICLFGDAGAVEALRPDHALIAALPDTETAPDGSCVIATAQGPVGGPGRGPARTIATAPGSGEIDVVSRYFAAKVGIAEDPVTGVAHTQLVPFWAERLGKARLLCRQASARGGLLACELAGDRVRMGGRAVLYAKGEIILAA